MIIYLIRRGERPAPQPAVIDRRYRTVVRPYPRIVGPAVLPLFCLAPHGVFRAPQITPRAVSSYLTFSPLPNSDTASYKLALPFKERGGLFSVTLSVTATSRSRRPR